MTFEWPSWVDPLPFPFPELHNNRYLIMKMLTLSSCPDWSPFSADISVCFFVDGGQIDMKFHPSRGYDRPLLSASPNDNWKTSYRLHQVSCILLSGHSYMMCLIIHVANIGHDMSTCYQVPWGLSLSLHGWWQIDSSASRSGGGGSWFMSQLLDHS